MNQWTDEVNEDIMSAYLYLSEVLVTEPLQWINEVLFDVNI